ncbi:MAG TPA: CBS domain-containing protein [Nitrospiria bacterium]|jgi:CBS domain-containing protein
MIPLAVLMSRHIQKIPEDGSLFDASKIMRDMKIGSLLVERDQEYVGVLSETDLVRRALAEGVDLKKTRVDSIMSTPIITIDINKSGMEASELMSDHRIRHLAVTEHGKIVGVISVRDLLIYFKNRF